MLTGRCGLILQGTRTSASHTYCNALHTRHMHASDLLEHISNLASRACISNDFAAPLKCCQLGRNLCATVQLKCDCFETY